MKLYWWLFWLVPLALFIAAIMLRRRTSHHGRWTVIARSAMCLASFSPSLGVYGLFTLEQLQLRDSGDLLFEGVGLWSALLSSIACVIWLIMDRSWKNIPAWLFFAGSVWTLAVWSLILMAIQ